MKAELAKELRDHENIVRLINIFYKPNKLLRRQRHVADKVFKPAGGRFAKHGTRETLHILDFDERNGAFEVSGDSYARGRCHCFA